MLKYKHLNAFATTEDCELSRVDYCRFCLCDNVCSACLYSMANQSYFDEWLTSEGLLFLGRPTFKTPGEADTWIKKHGNPQQQYSMFKVSIKRYVIVVRHCYK